MQEPSLFCPDSPGEPLRTQVPRQEITKVVPMGRGEGRETLKLPERHLLGETNCLPSDTEEE